MEFEKIAPYLQDPMILTGFGLFLFFGFGRALLKAGILPTLTQAAGYRILSRFLLYGFVLALAVIALGFGLKYRELSRAEQERAVQLLIHELAANLEKVQELDKNIDTITGATETISQILRHPGIKIMSGIFPADNLDPSADLPASLDYSRSALELVADRGLLDDELETQKFNEAAQAITGTIHRTKLAITSLADPNQERYPIATSVWDNHLPILRKVEIISVGDLRAAYNEMQLLRNQYDVSVGYSIGYVEAVDDFFSGEDRVINAQRLASVLAAERIFILTIAEFSAAFDEKTARIGETLQRIGI
ncbi:hypothetical protein [Dinoroseobacter sp. S76]|uniref:hypothetical protein n=1 Tax=Dinoroseobacter sp. S76 TaxID=3415124 RepID=UPI003C7ED10A